MVPRPQRKQRRTKKTILIVGEGPTEKAFLQHIVKLYVTRDMPIAVKIHCGSGGSPQSVVEKAIRLKQPYDKCFVLVDSDVPFEPDKELQKRMNRKPRIEMLYPTPCIEGLMLAILQHPKFSKTKTSSDECKRMFDTYVPEDKKTDKRAYEGVFSKEMIGARRKNVQELDDVLMIIDE